MRSSTDSVPRWSDCRVVTPGDEPGAGNRMGVDVDPGWQLDAVGSKYQGLLPKKEGLGTTALFISVERRELGGGRDLHEFSMDQNPPGNQS